MYIWKENHKSQILKFKFIKIQKRNLIKFTNIKFDLKSNNNLIEIFRQPKVYNKTLLRMILKICHTFIKS